MDPNQPLLDLEEPPELTEIEPFNEYHENYYKQAVINNINQDPQEFDTSKPSLVCNKPGHTFDNCPVLNNILHLKKYYISWKNFLERTARQQDELNHANIVNLLETKYYNAEQEQDYGVDEEIDLLHHNGEEETNSQELADFM